MNHLLIKHKPSDISEAKWKELWANSRYLLEPLAKALQEMQANMGSGVRADDFETPNHYAKLVAVLSKRQVLQDVIDMLPKPE